MKTGAKGEKELLSKIVSCIKKNRYLVTQHCWEKVVEVERPRVTTSLQSIATDEPEIIERYTERDSCLILSRCLFGLPIHTVIVYDSDPIRIVTTYHPAGDKWVDYRERRK